MRKLINLEGISGTGKTFYLNELEKNYKNRKDVIFVKEIFDDKKEDVNKKIFSALYHTGDRFFDMGVPLTETMLLLAKNMYKYERVIKKELELEKVVIEDRGIDTIAVYQALLIQKKYGINVNSFEIIDAIHKFIDKYTILPQKTIFFYGDVEGSIKRAEKRDGVYFKREERELLERAEEVYIKYANLNHKRFIKINLKNNTTNSILQIVVSEIGL